MDFCTIAFCLANLTVTGEVYQPHWAKNETRHWCETHWCKGPMGELRITMDVPLHESINVVYGFKHQSFITENDRGMNTVFLSLTWRPFR